MGKNICETCKDITCLNYSTTVEECLDYERMTNADRIRAMTDEELARFIAQNQIGALNVVFNALCDLLDIGDRAELKAMIMDGEKDVGNELLLWLKAPVEVDE